MNELALFAGAGGGILASDLIGLRTVCAVEIDDYARSVLVARQNDGILRPFPVWDDVRSFDGKPWYGLIDVVSGGFPCTDISVARAMWGRDGINGESSGLWDQYLRIIDECEPGRVFGENSEALKDQGLDQIVRALSERGYVCRWITLSARDCGLPHLRKRLWFLATHADKSRLEGHARHGNDAVGREDARGPSSDVVVPNCSFCGHKAITDDRYGCSNCHCEGLDCEDSWQGLQSGITGMANGVAYRVDRIKAIGNGQVPRVAATAWKILNEH